MPPVDDLNRTTAAPPVLLAQLVNVVCDKTECTIGDARQCLQIVFHRWIDYLVKELDVSEESAESCIRSLLGDPDLYDLRFAFSEVLRYT